MYCVNTFTHARRSNQ